MIDDFTAGVTSKRLDDGNGPLLVFRRALGRDVGRKRRKPGNPSGQRCEGSNSSPLSQKPWLGLRSDRCHSLAVSNNSVV